jgi:hypothetical protein
MQPTEARDIGTHQTTDRFQPYGQDPTHVGSENYLSDFLIIDLKLAPRGRRPASGRG